MAISPHICYIICSAPRSGSHLFSNLLADTQLAGRPQEHFNPWHMGHTQGEFPKQLIYQDDYVRDLIAKHTTPNNVFGTKAQFTQITNFVGLDRLESLFPTQLRYIYVQRMDELRQAISLARATQTDQWDSTQSAQHKPVYNFYQILGCQREIAIQTKGWETYFTTRGVKPFRVIYEELVNDRESIVRDALKFLGIAIPHNFQVSQPQLRKQADHLTDQWVEKFKAGGR